MKRTTNITVKKEGEYLTIRLRPRKGWNEEITETWGSTFINQWGEVIALKVKLAKE